MYYETLTNLLFMFRHRCLSQRVPWHFGQLLGSLQYVIMTKGAEKDLRSFMPVEKNPFHVDVTVFFQRKRKRECL